MGHSSGLGIESTSGISKAWDQTGLRTCDHSDTNGFDRGGELFRFASSPALERKKCAISRRCDGSLYGTVADSGICFVEQVTVDRCFL